MSALYTANDAMWIQKTPALGERDARHPGQHAALRGAERAADVPLPFGELGEQVDEDVGHRDAAGNGEPDAARRALQEAHRRRGGVDGGEHHGREEDGSDGEARHDSRTARDPARDASHSCGVITALHPVVDGARPLLHEAPDDEHHRRDHEQVHDAAHDVKAEPEDGPEDQ